jgi:5'-nucleotidase / UDP-sugar diphosphatase
VNVKRVSVTTETQEDEEILKINKNLEYQLEKKLQEKIGETLIDLDFTKTTLRVHESAVGNMISDYIKEITNSDICFLIAGVISGNKIIKKGDLTFGDAMSIFPWGGNICIIELTGKDIWDSIENGISVLPSNYLL